MQDFSWYLRRLQSMDSGEITWRIRSLVRDQLDIIRIPAGLVPKYAKSAGGSFSDFEPGFSCSPIDQHAWQRLPNSLRVRWEATLLHKANNALENRLSYFDLENQFHDDPWNWHRDFSAEKDCPLRLSILTDYRNFETFGDCKLVWEPNRHHQLVVLGRAYVITGERRYALKVAELLRSWINTNPFGYGMNWKSPLELGVRLINWVWALDLIRGSGVINDELWFDIINTVYRMTWDTQRKFSRGSSANNHLIGELAGVYVACCYFPDMPSALLWKKTARQLLEREIIAQTYADGCTREHAFNYEFFIIQFFTTSLLAGQAVGDMFSASYKERLHSMYRFMHDLSSDTGRPPNAGDADDGYVLDLGNLPLEPIPLLAVGEILFDDPRLASEELSESAFWLFGQQALSSATPSPTLETSFYPESGYFILRSGQNGAAETPSISVFFDCAELGYGPIAAHGHADCLSFCLSVDGIPVFVDPGTYDYFSFPELRDYFRQTCSHNTVEINNVSQSESLGPFLWGSRAQPEALDFSVDNHTIRVAGRQSGYERFGRPILHKRTVQIDRAASSLSIADEFTAKGRYGARTWLHLAPDWQIEQIDDHLQLQSGHLSVHLICDRGTPEVISGSKQPGPGWVSPAYHVLQKSSSILIENEFVGDASSTCLIKISRR